MMTDPIADFLTRIRNAIASGKDRVEIPASKIKANIAKVLKEEGYIKSFKIVIRAKNDIKLKVILKPGAIQGLERVSSPGLRRYRSYNDMPRVLSGLGVSIVSTSKGVISSRHARKDRVGGEVLCNVW
jgi:small subunit ribosomal protein S8